MPCPAGIAVPAQDGNSAAARYTPAMDRSATPRLSPPFALLAAAGAGARLLLTPVPNDPLPTAALVLGWGVSYGLVA